MEILFYLLLKYLCSVDDKDVRSTLCNNKNEAMCRNVIDVPVTLHRNINQWSQSRSYVFTSCVPLNFGDSSITTSIQLIIHIYFFIFGRLIQFVWCRKMTIKRNIRFISISKFIPIDEQFVNIIKLNALHQIQFLLIY